MSRALSDEPRRPRASAWLEISAAALVCTLTALAVTWPLAADLTRAHSDIFTPAHLLVQHHIGEWLAGRDPDLSVLPSIEFPGGVHVQVVAWPTVLLGALLERGIGPVAGLNVAQIVLLALGGVVFSRAASRLGAPAPLLAGAAWTAQPLFLHFASTGQFENAAALPFALCVWGPAAGGIPGAAVLGAGVLAASFSSPYQVIVIGLFIGLGLLALRPSRAWLLAIVAVVALLPAWRYYGDTDRHGRPEMGPGPSLERISIQRPQSLYAQRVWSVRAASPLGDTLQLQVQALREPATRRPDPTGIAEEHAPYLGAVAGVIALAGLIGGRRRPVAWAAGLLAGASLLLALGDGSIGGVPLPWGLTRSLPNLSRMGMSYRFVSGIALAHAILSGWALPGLRLRWAVPAAVAFTALIVVDGGAFGSFKLPLATREMSLAAGYAGLPDDRSGVLPLPAAPMRDNATLPQLSPSFPPAMAVLHQHPIAYALSGDGPMALHDLPLIQGARGRVPLTTANVAASLVRLRAVNVHYVVLDTTQLPASMVTTLRELLTAALGPPVAEGDGVVGWLN